MSERIGKLKETLVYTSCSDEQVNWGSCDDPRGLLTEGQSYELLETEPHSWHTKFTLADYPDKKFNSTCFKPAEEIDYE